jgi:hypothetical protein
VPRKTHSQDWIRTLAEPYLRGYQAAEETRGSLRGFRFCPQGQLTAKARCGFFAGYLVARAQYKFLQPQPPECIVFAFVEPVRSNLYRRLVAAEGSLFRNTAEYIRWLTHHLPRFVFSEEQTAVLVRHNAMGEWPSARHDHYSRNFYIETLAWLVRSALVRKLALEVSAWDGSGPPGQTVGKSSKF